MTKKESAYSQIMKVKLFDIEAQRMICVMNHVDVVELGIFPLDRVEIKVIGRNKRIVTVVDVTKTMVKPNEIGIFKDVKRRTVTKKGKQSKNYTCSKTCFT